MKSHLNLAHQYWRGLVSAGDIVVDATCGNGHDSLTLSHLALSEGSGGLVSCDIQEQALINAQELLAQELSSAQQSRVLWRRGCHSKFPEELREGSVKLVVYNLGYLPGGDKSLTTQVETTLQSVEAAQELLMSGGALSITCYPGHAEGAREEEALLGYVRKLDPAGWSCCHHRWLNREKAPSLLWIQKLEAR